MKIHRALGNGFQEVVYQRALAIELIDCGINFAREQETDLYYKKQKIGTRRVDFLIENKIMIELKAVITLDEVHLAQAINYMEAYQLKVGLLINFGSRSLQFKRVHNNKLTINEN